MGEVLIYTLSKISPRAIFHCVQAAPIGYRDRSHWSYG